MNIFRNKKNKRLLAIFQIKNIAIKYHISFENSSSKFNLYCNNEAEDFSCINDFDLENFAFTERDVSVEEYYIEIKHFKQNK